MKKRYAIHIRGKVQGVFFRTSAADQARALGVTGFVRNESDGSVYAEAEGEEGAVTAFADWCRQGPSQAQVTEVQIQEKDVLASSSFEIQ